MLFSEPKIPQCGQLVVEHARGVGFSALQRAENSSISERDFFIFFFLRFSALQRAENSSIEVMALVPDPVYSFSALQRAENSSIG